MTDQEIVTRYPWAEGVRNEIINDDCYKIKSLPFTPTIIFDLGANVGFFSRHAQSKFPDAKIIAVEPFPPNTELFRAASPSILLIEKAIGIGENTYQQSDADNGSQQSFISDENFAETDSIRKFESTSIQFISFDKLYDQYVSGHDLVMAKIDIECGERGLLFHELSLERMKQIDYIAMEIHSCATCDEQVLSERSRVFMVLDSFRETHYYEIQNDSFYAMKKQWGKR